MDFDIEKSALQIMKSGKRQLTKGIELLSQGRIKFLEEKENSLYLQYWKQIPLNK